MSKRRRQNVMPKPRGAITPAEGLAPLSRYDPEKIVAKQGKQRLAEFLLALSVAFNDLKGILIWRDSHQLKKPADADAVTPSAGEWNGMEIQFHRLLVAHLHELLNLIEAYETEATGADVRNVLAKAPASTRHHWDDLVRTATGKGTAQDAKFAEILVLTRNNAAYHYNQAKPLVAGFRKHFFQSARTPHHEAAFASVGLNMEQTRFYFADAAMQATLENLAGQMGTSTFNKRLVTTIKAVNQALNTIITGMIDPAKLS